MEKDREKRRLEQEKYELEASVKVIFIICL